MSIASLGFRSANQQLYASAYQSAHFGRILYNPSLALSEDPAIYEKMLRDPILRQAIDYRRFAVAPANWTITPPSEDPADVLLNQLLESIIRACPRPMKGIRHLSRAFFAGSEFVEPRGEIELRKLSGDTQRRRWFIPKELKHIDHRRFRQWVYRDPFRIQWQMSPARYHAAQYTDLDGRDGRKSADYFVKHVYDDSEQYLGHGGGLVDAAYWYFYSKGIIMREGVNAFLRWAQGWVVYKKKNSGYDPADTNQSIMQDAIEEIETHAGRHILGIDLDDDLQVFEGPKDHNATEFWLNYLDGGATRLITGSLLPMGGGADVGSNARGGIEQETSSLFIQTDQEDLADTLSADYLGLLFRVNKPTFSTITVGGTRLSDANLGRWTFLKDAVEDTEVNTRNATALLQAGVPLLRSDLEEKTGFQMPDGTEDESEIIRPREVTAPSSPFMGQ